MEEEGIGTRMWVEDPIAFAKCVELHDLTVMKEMVAKRVELAGEARGASDVKRHVVARKSNFCTHKFSNWQPLDRR